MNKKYFSVILFFAVVGTVELFAPGEQSRLIEFVPVCGVSSINLQPATEEYESYQNSVHATLIPTAQTPSPIQVRSFPLPGRSLEIHYSTPRPLTIKEECVKKPCQNACWCLLVVNCYCLLSTCCSK